MCVAPAGLPASPSQKSRCPPCCPVALQSGAPLGGTAHVNTNILHLTRFAPPDLGRRTQLTVRAGVRGELAWQAAALPPSSPSLGPPIPGRRVNPNPTPTHPSPGRQGDHARRRAWPSTARRR